MEEVIVKRDGRFKKGPDPRRNTKGSGLKYHWIHLFNECYTDDDFRLCIEALKDAILDGKPWAIKLVIDKCLPDKLEVENNQRENTLFERLGISPD